VLPLLQTFSANAKLVLVKGCVTFPLSNTGHVVHWVEQLLRYGDHFQQDPPMQHKVGQSFRFSRRKLNFSRLVFKVTFSISSIFIRNLFLLTHSIGTVFGHSTLSRSVTRRQTTFRILLLFKAAWFNVASIFDVINYWNCLRQQSFVFLWHSLLHYQSCRLFTKVLLRFLFQIPSQGEWRNSETAPRGLSHIASYGLHLINTWYAVFLQLNSFYYFLATWMKCFLLSHLAHSTDSWFWMCLGLLCTIFILRYIEKTFCIFFFENSCPFSYRSMMNASNVIYMSDRKKDAFSLLLDSKFG
jgi:hypothetical protein